MTFRILHRGVLGLYLDLYAYHNLENKIKFCVFQFS